MSMTWCQIGASLCLIGVSAWGIHEWVTGGPARPETIPVSGPVAPAEETAAVLQWAMEHAQLGDHEESRLSRRWAPAPLAAAPTAHGMSSQAIPVPWNVAKGGGKVSYVGRSTIHGGGTTVGREASRDFTRALGKSEIQRSSRWVPRFSGSRR